MSPCVVSEPRKIARRLPFERALLGRARRLIRPGDATVVVGVSGGPDSTALLLGLQTLAHELGIECLVAAHLDHGLRGEAARADRDFVLALATRLGCRFQEARASDLEERARGRGIEAAAREARYEFLLDVAEEAGASVVAVAHTATDQAETVLLRILRGAGLRGLGAMPASRRLARGSRVRLIRPLLSVSRSEVLEYVAARAVEAREDAMNKDPRFARTRVRHELLPRARELVNPAAERALGRVARAARAAARVLEKAASSVLHDASAGAGDGSLDETVTLARAALAAAPEAVLEVALARVLRRLVPERLARVHVRALVRLVRRGGGAVALPRGLEARLEAERLVVGPAAAPRIPSEPGAPELPLAVPGRALDAPSGLIFEARVVAAPDSPDFSGDDPALVAHLDRARAQGRLAVRRRRAGDRFVPLGSSGATTLKRFFIDRKIPREERARIPIVTLDDLPIWVVGERIDDRMKVTSETRDVLELRASPAAAPGDLP
jgi:tRNA(Ile)-lysidine synthase